MSFEYNLDMSGVQETSFELLPKGKYPVIIKSVTFSESASSEHPHLVWRLQISDGEYAGRSLPPFRTPFKPEGLGITLRTLKSFGVPEQVKFRVDEDTNFVTEPDLVDRAATATVVHDMYQGEARNKVRDLVGDSTPSANGSSTQPKGRSFK